MHNFKLTWLSNPHIISTIEPSADEPISWDHDGKVLSCFGDDIWFLPNFRIGSVRRFDWEKAVRNTPALNATQNKQSAKQLVLLRMTYGRAFGYTACFQTIEISLKLLVYCQSQRIEIQRFSRYPKAQLDFFTTICPQHQSQFLALARTVLVHDETLGWSFLDSQQIESLQRHISRPYKQTPVIPLDILQRFDLASQSIVKGFLSIADDFIAATYDHLSYRKKLRNKGMPGYWPTVLTAYPALDNELSRFEWLANSSNPRHSYLKLIRQAAFWIMACGSAARKSEILSLKRGCHQKEDYPGSNIHRIVGNTTKTQQNNHAIWIVAPRVADAVKALERTLDWYYAIHPSPPVESEYLFQIMDMTLGRKLSPSQQRMGTKLIGEPSADMDFRHLAKLVNTKVSQKSMDEARLMCPTLDTKKFQVGECWKALPHQIRRTVLIHAAASGLVSQDSLSYQAKHQTYAMTAYYTHNYWHLKLNYPNITDVIGTDDNLANEFVKEYSESYNRDRDEIGSNDRFFSFYGDDHKRQIINGIPLLSHDEIKSGKKHEVLKLNTLGICAQAEFCEFQSSINVRGCMTKTEGEPCTKAIFDKTRISELNALIQDLQYRLDELRSHDTFERDQIEADIVATQNAIKLMEDS